MDKANRAGNSDKKDVQDIKRRSSFDIASDYVELNFRPIIDLEQQKAMSKRELRAKRKADKKRQKQHHYVRNSIISVCLLLAVGAGIGSFWWMSSSSPVSKTEQSPRQFVVDQGATTNEIAASLQKAGFIRSPLAFRIYLRLNNSVIQAGTHMLSPSYSLADIVKKLATADTDEISIQIPPGLTLDELKTVFKKYDYTDAEIETALNAKYDNAILADKPAGTTLEGYIYPDTYRVFGGDKLEVVIGKALDQLELVAKQNNLQEKFAAKGLTFYQGITLASIVTKEVLNAEDQRLVASVFYNRLYTGMTLGSDVTFQYAYKMGLCNSNTPNCDSIYNTRIHGGLPPGPIANPSLAALKATADPASSNYLYFVAGEDGKTYFSETADQHNQAVADHCGSLCQ